MASTPQKQVEIYDTTLRDGTQGEGVALSLVDKLKVARQLDRLGVDYIEGGYPLSNPKDVAFFEQVRDLDLNHAKITAFGMTRRKGISPSDDVGMNALVDSKTPVIAVVGKTWDLHVDEVLRVSREENLAMIRESVDFCCQSGAEVFYDAEHFFDGYRANPDYALQTLAAALESGATRLVLCDTNGGSLPEQICQAIKALTEALGAQVRLGIHVHNDGGFAVANSMAALEAGCVQVQGTINGVGERCGNADLTTVVANAILKYDWQCLHGRQSLELLTETSRYVYELANMNLVSNQPYVGSAAFAHKGGMHVHAVQRVTHSYEHVPPESVGNSRRILISELSGVSNVSAVLGNKFNIAEDKQLQRRVLERVQDLEHQGYQFEAANASFELLVRSELGQRCDFWQLDHYRAEILKINGEEPTTESIVKVRIGDAVEHHVAEGDGPVNALDGALRKCLLPHFEQINHIELRDYKVRVINASEGTAARVRVIIDSAWLDADDKPIRYFSTIGVSENIVDASWHALIDAFEWFLLETGAQVPGAASA